MSLKTLIIITISYVLIEWQVAAEVQFMETMAETGRLRSEVSQNLQPGNGFQK